MHKNAPALSALAATVLLTLGALPVAGAGGSSAPVPGTPEMSPEQVAINEYNSGLELRDDAKQVDERLAAETDAKKIAKLEEKREDLFEKAAKRFTTAVEKKDDFFQAYSSLGYSLRRLGRYEEAMTAYDRALSLNPNYGEAIEYRAEALLGLDRVGEAQEAYQRLTVVSATLAAELLDAFKNWAADESNADVAADRGVSQWIADRERVSTATASAAQGETGTWQ